MKYIILFILFFVYQTTIFSQNYSVSSYQKINEINGGFTGFLDSEDNLGVSIDEIGDLDGNGVNDLAVGAFSDDDGGYNRGAVWILFLDSTDNVISSTKISDISGNFTGILDDDDRFGGAVEYLGDLNNDGLIEIAVGADYDGDGGFWHGAVWILSLNTDGTVSSHSKISDLQGGFDGFINGDAIFGTDIVNIGDLNNDGVEDLAVGSRRDNDGGTNSGALWILFMNADFTISSYQKISSTNGGLGINLSFEDYFGGAVANLGDLNGDGVVDLAVGSYRDDDQHQNAGSIYILFLNSNGTVNDYQKISNLSGNLTSNISQGALFGESIDGVVDYDSDGKVEILVGAMKQWNTTLSTLTGGFYLIELNTDGTVSEENFYSYGENCFTGELNNGDLFGGAVCFLNTDVNNFKIAVGSYRDSENGYRKGAAWIINLGERIIDTSVLNPTNCNASDGEINISGLTNNTNYLVTYELDSVSTTVSITSNSTGEATVANLTSGNYTNISVEEDSSGCTETLSSVVLSGEDLSATLTSTDPTNCNASDGEINISGLSNNTSYSVTYELDSVSTIVSITSNSIGEATIANLTSGNYTNISIEEDSSGCTETLSSVVLSGEDLSATLTSTDPTNCNASDGEINISGLTNNTSYSVTYELDSVSTTVSITSNSTGEATIANLISGNYTNISIVEDSSGCTGDLGFTVLNDLGLSATVTSVDPTGCGVSDGELIFTGLSTDTAYNINYELNGVASTLTLSSNNLGELIITSLSSGNYANILFEEVTTGCLNTFDSVLLVEVNLSVTVTSNNPTACGLSDGEIIISGLSNNENYEIQYNLNSDIFTSNSSGEVIIDNLPEGTYMLQAIEEISTGCMDTLNPVELTGLSLSASIVSFNPSSCGLTDGEIIISGLSSNETYNISYNTGSISTSVILISNGFGEITIENLMSGSYSDVLIEELVGGCTVEYDFIRLDCEDNNNLSCFRTKPFFTPNGDTVNDTWFLKPFDQNDICSYRLTIYNRYGKLIKVLTNSDSQWDGLYNGNKMPSNDYWYVIHYNDGEKDLVYKSHFALKR